MAVGSSAAATMAGSGMPSGVTKSRRRASVASDDTGEKNNGRSLIWHVTLHPVENRCVVRSDDGPAKTLISHQIVVLAWKLIKRGRIKRQVRQARHQSRWQEMEVFVRFKDRS